MARCEYCGKEVYLPYKCKYCGGLFCEEHHLPENHDCLGLQILKQRRAAAGKMFTLPSATRFAPEYVASKRPVVREERRREEWEEELRKARIRSARSYQPSYSASSSSGSRAGYVLLGLVIAFVLVFAFRGQILGLLSGSGGTVIAIYTPVSPQQLTKSPELYVDKRVEVTGGLGISLITAMWRPVDVKIDTLYILQDNQGYYVYVVPPSESQRTLYLGHVYTARGVWRRVKFKNIISNKYSYFYILFAEEMVRKD